MTNIGRAGTCGRVAPDIADRARPGVAGVAAIPSRRHRFERVTFRPRGHGTLFEGLAVPSGAKIGFVGLSDAGKTSTVECIQVPGTLGSGRSACTG